MRPLAITASILLALSLSACGASSSEAINSCAATLIARLQVEAPELSDEDMAEFMNNAFTTCQESYDEDPEGFMSTYSD